MEFELLQLKDVVAAKNRIDPFINKTPILSSSLLNQWLGHEIYFKAEGFQKIGAFKARGACNTVAWLEETGQKPKHIIANSSGNHAQAVAWAAAKHGIPATIFMPETASIIKIKATQSYGAHVNLSANRNIVDEKVKEEAKKEGAYWIPPYNHNKVIAGQGTAAYEGLTSINNVDAVFAPCGGGGLLSGTLLACRGLSSTTEVIGAEPLNANDAAQSLRMGSIQKLTETPNTLADGAMTLSVGTLTFEYLKQLDDFMEINENDMVYWTQWLTHLLKVRIEPTSALSMQAAANWLSKQSGKKKVMIILSGSNIDQATNLKIWAEDNLTQLPSLNS